MLQERAADESDILMVRGSDCAAAIVVVAMLTLGLADFNATREMGPILALGVAIMVVAGLALLPAILAAPGRRSFRPAVPRPARRRRWRRRSRSWSASAAGGRRRRREPALGREKVRR